MQPHLAADEELQTVLAERDCGAVRPLAPAQTRTRCYSHGSCEKPASNGTLTMLAVVHSRCEAGTFRRRFALVLLSSMVRKDACQPGLKAGIFNARCN